MRNNIFGLLLAVSVWGLAPPAQGQIMCWNVENFFDTRDDSLTRDEPFTPKGEYCWTRRKFEAKRDLLAKCILAAGERTASEPSVYTDGPEGTSRQPVSPQTYMRPPPIIALCEVENRYVINSLLKDTPLAKYDYGVVHRDSPDRRGIDVALLYDRSRVRLSASDFLVVKEFATREVLYAQVTDSLWGSLHLFVNHWPSKRGGSRRSQKRRAVMVELLVPYIDSLQREDASAKIILMGDFNDGPYSPSIEELCSRCGLVNMAQVLLGTRLDAPTPKKRSSVPEKVPNTSLPGRNNIGTIRYKGKWELIDQFLVSPSAASSGLEMEIFAPPFLLEEDKAYLGLKPRRTNIGPRYNGGASDHLPILLHLGSPCPGHARSPKHSAYSPTWTKTGIKNLSRCRNNYVPLKDNACYGDAKY
ncbi:MAG: hypothetical protein HUJ91_06745 [Bacteroidales bacterium]|nr:hypothetical protein [Bacteroidales bacterium]